MSTKALDRAISISGGQSELARELTSRTGELIRQGHIWSWLNRTKRTPPEFAPYIEAITAEKGKTVTRQELCPNFPWHDVRKSRVSA